ncbi:BtrH N-terminal domain-containing protein [Staphylococcus pseudoxylosus]|uniref:BtrH N-terminal domain-containing protein n=1 Tax=Staphylococcus pseudoxylosus TaxID=2282419 RepID=UPI003F5560A4
MKENNINYFIGEHCETTATGTLLKFINIELSEPMLFGIGEGLGYIYWDMKNMAFPFLGGRIKPDYLTKNIVKNLNLEIHIEETTSIKKAWQNVKKAIDTGQPVGLKLDSYYLDYFTSKVHFAVHYVAMYDYDDLYAYLIDTKQQGSNVKTTLNSIEQARNVKGPMSSKNLSYTIKQVTSMPDMRAVVLTAIQNNAKDYLNPPIKNIGYKGIKKTSEKVKTWFERSTNIEADLLLVANLMENGGTGGALFRKMYKSFLKEAQLLIEDDALTRAYHMFTDIVVNWENVIELIKKAGLTQNKRFLNEASTILDKLAEQEYEAMNLLLKIKN